ncbi:hypothetical protein MY8738_003550 [Beauveria namnaoensis]
MAFHRSVVAAAAALSLAALTTATNYELPPCTDKFTPFTSKGCYTNGDTALIMRSTVSSNDMTVEKCTSVCKGNAFRYAGLTYYGVCYCGDEIAAEKTADASCNYPCNGDKGQLCGGKDTLNIWEDSTYTKTPSEVTVADYAYSGCYVDNANGQGRAFPWPESIEPAKFTPEACIAACKAQGFPIAASEYAHECWCGNVLSRTVKADEKDCNAPCGGDASKICGGGNRLSVYIAKDLESNEPCASGNPPTSSSTSTAPTTQPTQPTSTGPSTNPGSSTNPSTEPTSSSTKSTSTGSSTGPGTSTGPSTEPTSTGTTTQSTSTSTSPGTSTGPSTQTTSTSTRPGTSTGPSTQPTSTSTSPGTSTGPSTQTTSTSTGPGTSTGPSTQTTSTSTSPGTSTGPSTQTTSTSTGPGTSTGPSTQTTSTSTRPGTSTGPSTQTTSTSTRPGTSTGPSTQPTSTSTRPGTSTGPTTGPTTGPSTQPGTTTKPSTSTKPTSTAPGTCTTTIVTPPTCEHKIGNWCLPPTPEWTCKEDCYAAWKKCEVTVFSCFHQAGFPDSLNCFEYAQWCKSLKSYCNRCDNSDRCNKLDCWKSLEPGHVGTSTTQTATVPCTGVPTSNPPGTSTKPTTKPPGTTTKPTTSTKPLTSTQTSTSTTQCPPQPTNVCKQPTSKECDFGPGNPVGGVPLPIVTCNDCKDDFNANPFKMYTVANSKNCPSFPHGRIGGVCCEACKHQYYKCVEVYADSCKNLQNQPNFHPRSIEERESSSSSSVSSSSSFPGFGWPGWVKPNLGVCKGWGSYSGGVSASASVYAGGSGAWASANAWAGAHWGFGNNNYNNAVYRCKVQYDDCVYENQNINPSTECRSWGCK